jgi:hypothetical protein
MMGGGSAFFIFIHTYPCVSILCHPPKKQHSRGSEMVGNSAVQGGGVYADTSSTLTVERSVHKLRSSAPFAQHRLIFLTPSLFLDSAVRFLNNSAPRTSASSGGGGGVYVNAASLVVGRYVCGYDEIVYVRTICQKESVEYALKHLSVTLFDLEHHHPTQQRNVCQ